MARRTLQQQIEDLQNGVPMDDAAPTMSVPPPDLGGYQLPSLPPSAVPGPNMQTPQMQTPISRPKLSDIIQGQYDQASAPPTRKGALLKAIMEGGSIGIGGLLGGTAGAYGAGQGTEQYNAAQVAQNTEKRKELQTQLEAEKNREERGAERTMSVQEKAAEAALRQKEIEGTNAARLEGLKGTNQTRMDIQGLKDIVSQQGAAQKSTALDAQMQRAGFKKNETGEYVETPERVAERKAIEDLHSSQKELTDANAALAKAKNDPNSPAFKQAQERIVVAQQNASTARQRLGLSEQQFEVNTQGTVGGQQIPGGPTDAQGRPVGLATARATGPTVTARTKADQAKVVQAEGDKLIAEINANRQLLGPLKGRIENLERGIGSDTPEVAQLYTHLKSFASLQPALHGSRGIGYQKEFEKAAGNLTQNPDAVIASVKSLMGTAQSFANAGNPRQPILKQLDAPTAAKYLQQSGGDKDKARAAAKKDGYSF